MPSKRSRPGMSGVLGRLSWPVAAIRTSASCSAPPARVSRQRAAVLVEGGGEDLGAEADVPQDVEVAGDVAQVLVDLGLRGERRDQSAFGANESEYRWRRDVAGRARDRCCPARCRRRRRLFSKSTRSSMPACFSRTAAAMPPKPVPMMATLVTARTLRFPAGRPRSEGVS